MKLFLRKEVDRDGTTYELRIWRSPVFYYRDQWCGPEFRPWRKFLFDYISWARPESRFAKAWRR